MTTKARAVTQKVFNHVVHAPQHRDIRGWVSVLDFTWHFKCKQCEEEWQIKKGDVLDDPLLKSLSRWDDLDAPIKIVQEILKTPGVTDAKKNAWETLLDGFIDEDA